MKTIPKYSRLTNSILNLFSSTVGQIITSVLGFVVRTVFINTLGKTYLGIHGYFADILKLLSLTNLGFGTAISYRLYKPLAEGDDKRVRMLLKFYKYAYVSTGIIILLLGLSLIPFLPYLIKNYDRLLALKINAPLVFVICLMQTVVSYLFFAYRTAIMSANQKKYILNVADYAVTIITYAVQIAVLILWRNFILYLLVVIVFNILKNLFNSYISVRFYPQYFKKEPDSISMDEVKEMFKDCGSIFIFKVSSIVYKITNNMAIGYLLGMAEVGLYSNYHLFMVTAQHFLYKIYSSVQASTGNLFAVADVRRKYNFFETMNFITVVLYGTSAVGLAACSDEFITVWIGSDYLIGNWMSVIVAINMVNTGLRNNLGQIRYVSGVFKQMWYRPILGVFVNILCSIYFVKKIGIPGAVLGTVAADVLTVFMLDPYLIHKYTFNHYKSTWVYYRRNLIYFLLLAAICFADIKICECVFVGHGWFSVIFHVIISSASVPAVFIALYWKSHECQYLVSIAKRILDKVRSKTISR